MNITELIRPHALKTPNAIAYQTTRGETLTYAQLESTINAVAIRLRELGLKPGQTAVVGTERLGKFIAVILALARLGVAYAPMSIAPKHAAMAIVDRGLDSRRFVRSVLLDSLWPGFAPVGATVAPVASHDDGTAVLFQCPSSGTTGAPKFVPISHELAMRRADSRTSGMLFVEAGRDIADLRQACTIGPATSYGFLSILVALCGGGAVLEPCRSARLLPSWLVASRVNYLIASPIALQRMVEVLPDPRGNYALEIVEVGGGVLPAKVFDMARQRLCPTIIVNYGMTECGRVASAPESVLRDRPGAVGFLGAGVEIRIVDDDGLPVPAGEEGHLSIRSPRTASGYLDDDKATAEVFRDGWVYPRDRGALEPDGMLRLVGRSDDVINRGGIKIVPQRVEMAMQVLADLREVSVFGVPDAKGDVSVYAAIVPAGPLDIETFHALCRRQLGKESPQVLMQLKELPRNAAGKVLRHELVRIAQERARKSADAHKATPTH